MSAVFSNNERSCLAVTLAFEGYGDNGRSSGHVFPRIKARPVTLRVLLFLVTVSFGFISIAEAAEPIRVGSKGFTESVILGEVLTHLANQADVRGRASGRVWAARKFSGKPFSPATSIFTSITPVPYEKSFSATT